MKKLLLKVCFATMAIIIIIFAIWQPFSVIYLEKEITSKKALNEMPLVQITSDEMALFFRLAIDLNVEAAMETMTELTDEESRVLAHGIVPEGNVPKITVGFGSLQIDCHYDDYRIIFQGNVENIFKSVAAYKPNGDFNHMYSNRNNEIYTKTHKRLKFL